MDIKEVIIVEGKYDKIAVTSAVNATVLETSGFGIFSDRERLELIRKMAEKRGIIVLTDSDSAGMLIRNFLKGAVKENIKHAYIPDVYGKEKRKTEPSKENKLGVEGMKGEIIINALIKAGATFSDGSEREVSKEPITKTDMYLLGLSGGRFSSKRRRKLLYDLDLPENLSSNAMLEILNVLYDKEEFYHLLAASSMQPAPNIDISSTSQPSASSSLIM